MKYDKVILVEHFHRNSYDINRDAKCINIERIDPPPKKQNKTKQKEKLKTYWAISRR